MCPPDDFITYPVLYLTRMIILNEAQIKAWDAYTIAKGISSLALMEQAAVAVTDKLDLLLGEEDQEVLIICGNGNNGADGLAIARLLLESGS